MLNLNFININLPSVFKSRKSKSPVSITVRRINELIQAYGLKHEQLLNLVPRCWNWNLGDIQDHTQFLASIDIDVLEWFSETFDIKREWLEGASEQMHHHIGGYKNLPAFFGEMKTSGWDSQDLRMTILAEDYSTSNQFLKRYVVVFSMPTLESSSTEETFFRHRLFGFAWSYHHPSCVLDTKAVARWFTRRENRKRPIPIISVKGELFNDIAEGRSLLPNVWTDQWGSCDRFEDRVLYEHESVCAKETEDLDDVVAYLESSQLTA